MDEEYNEKDWENVLATEEYLFENLEPISDNSPADLPAVAGKVRRDVGEKGES